jgi:hypothetical protein
MLSKRCCLQRLALGLGGLVGHAVAAPESLCGAPGLPAYPAADKLALVQSWVIDGRRDGPLPDCSAMRGHDFELLVRVVATLHGPADIDTMLVRFGAVSRLKGATYWSFTDKQRQVLFKDAFAVDGPEATVPRLDFTAADLRSGRELYFVHSDNRSGKLSAYGMRLVQSTPDTLQLRVENVADLRMYGLTLLAAREMQWSVTLERLGPDRWGYRSLLGLRTLRLGRAEQHRLSNLSRSVAMYDLLAGRMTEIEAYR